MLLVILQMTCEVLSLHNLEKKVPIFQPSTHADTKELGGLIMRFQQPLNYLTYYIDQDF